MNIQQIQHLLDQGKLQEAYNQAVALVRAEPENKEARQLLNAIRNQAEQQNAIQIEQQLKQLQQLATTQPKEALVKAVDLHKQGAKDPALLNLINTLQKAISGNQQQQIDQIVKKATDLKNSQKYEQALAVLAKLQGPEIQKIRNQIVTEYVGYKVEKNAEQFKLLPPQKVISFLLKLKKLAPNHPKLNDELIKQQQRQQNYQALSQKQTVRNLQRQIKVLYHQKKYRKSIQAANQLLKLETDSKLAKKYLEKNQRGILIRNHKLAYEQLKQPKTGHLKVKKKKK